MTLPKWKHKCRVLWWRGWSEKRIANVMGLTPEQVRLALFVRVL